jgi:hypothetical protein
MADLREVSPQWTVAALGGIVSAEAIISLGHPQATPDGPDTTLYLEIEEDNDESSEDENIDPSAFVWRYGVGEEESGFGEAEYENGRAPALEEAKDDCWDAVVVFLRGEGLPTKRFLAPFRSSGKLSLSGPWPYPKPAAHQLSQQPT